ncbi:1-phosphofructokinase [Opitutaceae bacterium TAV1]|nr:1-phosphofructokinase [Opitutaceae bacterium TAV1]
MSGERERRDDAGGTPAPLNPAASPSHGPEARATPESWAERPCHTGAGVREKKLAPHRAEQAPEVITVTLNPAIDRTVTVPEFAAGEVNRAVGSHDEPGGKGVNVAAALARYGRNVAATGFLGRRNLGIFQEFFDELDIAGRFVLLEGETRTGIKIVDPGSGSTTDINLPGLAPSREELAELSRRLVPGASETPGASWYVLAGSLPPGVPVTIYADWIRALREHGAAVALDTSGEALRHAVEAGPTFVKPNIAELEALLGPGRHLPDVAAVIAAARELIARYGIGLVTVSMGAAGACFVTADEALLAKPPPIPVQSTVGAGDAMVAGVVHALGEGTRPAKRPLAEVARLATAFSLSALTLGQPTDSAGFRNGVAAWAPRVEIVPAGL